MKKKIPKSKKNELNKIPCLKNNEVENEIKLNKVRPNKPNRPKFDDWIFINFERIKPYPINEKDIK